MKLLYCNECGDIFNLTYEDKTCECGEIKGKYFEDGLHAWYSGNALPLGFANPSFFSAIENQPETGWGKSFEAFVIQKDCKTFRKK